MICIFYLRKATVGNIEAAFERMLNEQTIAQNIHGLISYFYDFENPKKLRDGFTTI